MRHVVSSNIPRTQLCKDPGSIKSKDVEPSITIPQNSKLGFLVSHIQQTKDMMNKFGKAFTNNS